MADKTRCYGGSGRVSASCRSSIFAAETYIRKQRKRNSVVYQARETPPILSVRTRNHLVLASPPRTPNNSQALSRCQTLKLTSRKFALGPVLNFPLTGIMRTTLDTWSPAETAP